MDRLLLGGECELGVPLVVEGVEFDDFGADKFAKTLEELKSEAAVVQDLV